MIVWRVAWKMLLADRGKLATALVGVVFSLVLVNIQGGLFIGLIRKASLLVDHSRADVWVGHRHMHNVDFAEDIPRRWVYRVRGVHGVAEAQPFLVGFANMTLPNGGFESIIVVGCEPRSLLGNAWVMGQGDATSIRRPESVIVDELEGDKLDYPELGDLREINHQRVRVEALSHGILGFIVAPYVFTSLDQAALQLRKGRDACSYILVRTADGADPSQVARDIAARCPELDAYPTETFSRVCIDFWLRRTGLGISFGASTVLGLVVGLVMVAQTLYASVLDRLSEFAAMKAIGAEDRHVYRLLLAQAMTMAVAGTTIGVACSEAIRLSFSTPRAPIVIPWWLTAGSCTLVTCICLAASLLPYLRVRKVDPVMVMLT